MIILILNFLENTRFRKIGNFNIENFVLAGCRDIAVDFFTILFII